MGLYERDVIEQAGFTPSGSPASAGGANEQIQFNDAGTLNGDVTMTFDKVTQNVFFQSTIDDALFDISFANADGSFSGISIQAGATATFLANSANAAGDGGQIVTQPAQVLIEGTGTTNVQVAQTGTGDITMAASAGSIDISSGPPHPITISANTDLNLNGAKIGFFGVAAVARQATPVTLGDVIALLQAYGLAT